MEPIVVTSKNVRICPFRTSGSHKDKKTKMIVSDPAYCTPNCPLCITKHRVETYFSGEQTLKENINYDACAFAVIADSAEKIAEYLEKLGKLY